VKAFYKKAKLNAFINETPFDYHEEIERAFAKVKKQSVVNCIRHANKIMEIKA